MSTSPEQIDIWRSTDTETQHLEFKEAKTQFDNRKLYKYCVALANEGGGYLLLGIADTPPRPVVGTAAFNNPVAMAEKLFEAVGFRKVIQAVEAYQLPAPDFRPAFRRTEAVLYGPKSFDEMDRDARVRACYQHCALQYVLRKQMTNQSLRERFQLPERKAEAVSRTIRDAIDAERIRLSDPKQKSLRYRSYVPYWA